MPIRIVSDGSPIGVKIFDEDNNDITNIIGKNCTGITISLNAASTPVATFRYTMLPCDIKTLKVDKYKKDPIQSIFLWQGKDVSVMSINEINDIYNYIETNRINAPIDFMTAVNNRHREISRK